MHRNIIGFHQDEQADWVADLDCGHGQHTRHQPPFQIRPWVQSEAGRASKIGETLNCVRCDRLEIPDDFLPFKKTPEFNRDTLPEGLKANHKTAPGIWARIHVLEGQLTYRIADPVNQTFHLNPDQPGTVLPEILHHVEADAAVRFYVEFYRKQ